VTGRGNPIGMLLELEVTSLAAGGDGIARDAAGRVTFVPRTAPGDRIRARIVHRKKNFARAELVDVLVPAASRVEPSCPRFAEGCGGCQWLHIARGAQLAAKHAQVAGALRKHPDLVVHPIGDPGPALGWRRRARFHVGAAGIGLYQEGSHAIVPIDHCPQLEPALDAALAAVAAASPPPGELALLVGHTGEVVVATTRDWRAAGRLVGVAGIRGVQCGSSTHGDPVVEIEPGLWGGPWDFAQASTAGNQLLIALAREATGRGPGTLLELYAGAGNLTRGLVADGWTVTASDVVAPGRPTPVPIVIGTAEDVVARIPGPVDAVVLDPPRTGADEVVDGIVRLAPRVITYVSCDVATLARDAARLVDGGYRATDAWPIDLMPQTAHVELVMRLVR
jgi:23S rRNA (uracil1939-C5)-methyltransferase